MDDMDDDGVSEEDEDTGADMAAPGWVWVPESLSSFPESVGEAMPCLLASSPRAFSDG